MISPLACIIVLYVMCYILDAKCKEIEGTMLHVSQRKGGVTCTSTCQKVTNWHGLELC